MKLRCHRPSLANAFQVVGGVVPTRTPKDILKNVKLQVTDGVATLIGTNQEVGIRFHIPDVEADMPGETLLPTQRITSILREVQDDEVELDISDKAVVVRCGHSEFRLSAEDPAEFPAVADFQEDKYHIIPGGTFKEMIRRTTFATDPESHRYALGGVLFQATKDQLTMVATDARRLALVQATCGSDGVEELENQQPVIPKEALTLVERSITSDEEDVFLAIHANEALIKCGHSTIYARLIEGRFPPYNNVIPKTSNTTVDLIAGPFYAAVRQAQIVTNEETRGVDFTFTEGLLTLKSQAADVGESKIEVPVTYADEELTIKFEPRYLAEYLRVIEPETAIQMALIDAESAAVMKTEDQYTYVIMPLSQDR